MPSDNSIIGMVSLVIAITGHRDLHPEDVPWFETEIGNIFKDLRLQYSNTPLLLLSGLAEGADRIAVRAAKAVGVPYIAVFPMPTSLYRQDFTSEASDAEFEEFRSGALRVIELPLAGDCTPEDAAQTGNAPNLQYELLGRFLVQYSQILIAIWDQDRAIVQGGTSHVVAMKLGEGLTSDGIAFARLNKNSAGPVYVLPARRISS